VSGAHNILWTRFRFLYPPSGRRIELVRKLRCHIVVGKVYARYANTIVTFVKTRSGEPLPKGSGSCSSRSTGGWRSGWTSAFLSSAALPLPEGGRGVSL
jgi:hypothetical protein